MDKMLVRYILMLIGVAVGCNSLRVTDDLKNDTSDSIPTYKSIPVSKPKRQLDNFDFDVGSFEGSAFFKHEKTDDTTSLDILDGEDFSGFLPATSKVARSNTHDLGNHGTNYDSSSLSSENYQSDPGVTQKLPETHADFYSSEDQSALSQAHLSTTINNPATTPHNNNNYNQPKFIPTKPSTFLMDQKSPPTLRYNSYSPLSEYASGNPIYSSPSQLPIQTVSPSHSTHPVAYTIPYKTQFSHSSKAYAPLHNHNLQQQQYVTPFQNAYNNIHFTTAPTVEINGKRLALPILQLQTEIPSYVQNFENAPVIFSAESGLQYKTQPGLGVSFDFAKPKNNNQRLGTNAPFLVTHNPRSIQVLPLQTSSSTAQFPQYKGASVSQFPSRGFSKIPNDYQEFKLQPQLHFNKNTNNKNNGYNGPKTYQKPGAYSNPSENIRTDVEVIDVKKKKKPTTPSKNDDEEEKDDGGSEEDYADKESYLLKDEDDDTPSRKNFKESEFEGDFVPSKSYPFKEYGENFSKSKKSNFDNDDNDDDDDDSSVNLAAKYRYSANSDDDEDDREAKDENESLESEPKSKYKSLPTRDETVIYAKHYGVKNDEDEDGTDIKEKKNHFRKSERNDHSKKKRRTRKDRGHNNKGHEQSSGKKYHKPTFSNYQSSTEFDANYSKSRPNYQRPDGYVKNKYRAYRDESGEPSTRPSTSSLLQSDVNFDSRSKEKFNEPSMIQSSRSKLPKTIWTDSYGKILSDPDEDSNISSFSKEEAVAMCKHSYPRSLPTTTQEYTTRPAHKTSTILSKGLTNLHSSKTTESAIGHHHPTWKKEKRQKINFSAQVRPATTGIQGLVHPTQKFFNLESDRTRLHRSNI